MSKKHYFLNSIYLLLCLSFVFVASFLNFQDSSAKQATENPLNVEFQFPDDELEIEDNIDSEFAVLSKIEKKHGSEITSTFSATYQPSSVYIQSGAPVSYGSYISIAGRTLRIEDVNDTLIDSTDHVNRWGRKFLYGHNSSSVFGPMRSLSNGATFKASLDGEEHTYQIVYMETMEKPKVEQNMLGIAYANYGGARYDLSLMTCAGTSLGGGDATHRLVVFANKIS